MRKELIILSFVLVFVAAAIWLPRADAFQRYNSGCQNCHGAFTDGTTKKGSTFPSNNKHEMHRASNYMNTECDLCHTSGDNRNPYLGSSTGTANNNGLGCVGCHNEFGLRAHHINAGVTSCASSCHPDDPAPPPESTMPVYYGTADTNADNPCNTVGQERINENWTIGDFEGLDNDGDGLYDGDDPDCQVPECSIDSDCDDGLYCNGAETCDANGTCVSGTVPSCDDGVDCTIDSCDDGVDACVNQPDNGACADTNNCTDDICTSNGCTNDPVVCSPGEQCDQADGVCKTPPECTANAECDDGLFCNGAETCDGAGSCQAGTNPCQAGETCNDVTDTCDALTCAGIGDKGTCDADPNCQWVGKGKNASCQDIPPAEICDSGIDEDGDGLIDCDDPDCAGVGNCSSLPCAGLDRTACQNDPTCEWSGKNKVCKDAAAANCSDYNGDAKACRANSCSYDRKTDICN